MKALLRKIRQILRDRRTRRFLTRFVSGVAAVVVFVTTYALVLPAITMESEAACGIEAHQHDDSCYSENLICGQEESEGHHHTDDCYTVSRDLECDLEEHQHSSENGCFDEEGNLVCKQKEHTHSDSCYKEHRELTCGLEESEGHHHTDSCYEKILTCGKEVHTHSAACYKANLQIESAAVASTGMTSAAAVPSLSEEDYYSENSKDSKNDTIVSESLDKAEQTDAVEDTDEDADDKISPEENSVDETEAEPDGDIKAESGDSDKADEKDKGKDKSDSKEGEEAASSFSTGFAADEDAENGDAYIPDKDALDFSTVLNRKTGIYFYHVAEDEDIEDSSAITEWEKADEGIELNPEDIIRVYLSYTLPKDTINATNDISRYRLPDTLHLTDEQIEAINNCENGISAQYINYDNLEITDPDRHTTYLGLESVEGTRRPGEELKEDSQEYISAVVRAEKIYDEETGEYEGTDLIFTFSPYAVEKNAHAYDKKGQPTRAGEEVTGWLTLDFNMGQIDWDEDNTSEIVFAEEDKISTVLKQADSEEAETDESAADGTTEAAAEYATEETAAAATTAAETAAENSTETATADTAATAATASVTAAESISEKTDADAKNDSENGKDSKDEITAANYPAAVFDDSITVRSGRLDTDLADTDIPKKTKMTVHVEADEGTFPEGTKMVLSTVEDLSAVAEAVGTAVDSKTRGFQAVDITFYDKDPSEEDAKEIEPLKPIRVSIKSDEIKKAAEDSSTAPVVVHIEDDNTATEIENTASKTDSGTIEIEKPAADPENTSDPAIQSDDGQDNGSEKNTDSQESNNSKEINPPAAPTVENKDESTDTQQPADTKESVDTDKTAVTDESAEIDKTTDNLSENEESADKASTGDTVEFEADSFSIYAIVYTVDFHWEVDGKTYEFSIPGGGFVSLEHLVEVLRIANSGSNEQSDAEGSNWSNEEGVESVNLNNVSVSEDTRKFVADVSSVEFTTPDLVDISRVEADTTVGQIKSDCKLEIQYSAGLAEEQIAELNEQKVEEGDWALISVQPFTSEESMTVTMKDGEVFTIRVTDAQIKQTVIDAKGDTWEITVTYDEDAQIPDGAELNVREILPEDEEYEELYEEASKKASKNAEKQGIEIPVVTGARLFDIEIHGKDGKIEPKSPVQVDIRLEGEKADLLSVVHFAKDGAEVMELQEMPSNRKSSDNAGENTEEIKENLTKEVSFETESFSVYTVVDVSSANLTSDGPYILVSGIQGDPGADVGYQENWGTDFFTKVVNGMAMTNETREHGLSSIGVHVWTEGTQGFVGGEATQWTFEQGSDGRYYIKDSNGHYLKWSSYTTTNWFGGQDTHYDGMSLTENRNEATQFTVTATGADDGSVYLTFTDQGATWYLHNNQYSGANEWSSRNYMVKQNPSNDEKNSSAYRFKLCKQSNAYDSFAATKVSSKQVTTDTNYVIYHKFEDEAGNEELYALAHDGTFVRVYDGGDRIYWRETDKNIYWNYQSENGHHLFSVDPDTHETVYLNPVASGDGQTMSSTDDYLTLIGKENGEYGTTIERWDQVSYDYAGLHVVKNGNTVELVPGTRNAGTSDEFLFAVASTMPSRETKEPVPTVDSDSLGIKITMFDYGEPDGNYAAGDKLPEMTAVAGSDAYTPHAAHALVKSYLVDGLPANNSGDAMTGLFDHGGAITNTITDVNHLFLQSYYDENGTFRYRSEDNYAYIPLTGTTGTTTNDFTVYRQVATPYTTDRQVGHAYYYHGHFMPFNDIDMKNHLSRLLDQYGTQEIPLADGRTYEDVYGITGTPNYYTGMKMEASFVQPSNGVLENGDDMVFKFTGDDDMWVYIDGILVLDIGGIHEPLSGTINFRTGEVTNPEGSSLAGKKTLYEIFMAVANDPNTPAEVKAKINAIEWNGGTFADFTTHSFGAFYMERGAGASNLDLQFNLKIAKTDEFVVRKELPEGVDDRFVNQRFKYQATYIDTTETDDSKKVKPLYPGTKNKNNEEICLSVTYKDRKDPVTGQPVTVNVPVDENGYFYLFPGEAAVFKVANETIEYDIKEVTIDQNLIKQVDINSSKNVTVTDDTDVPANGKIAEAGFAKVIDRGEVVYTNHPQTQNLRITKHLSSDSAPLLEGENPVFEFRVYLESPVTDNQGNVQVDQNGKPVTKLVPYSYGPYYLVKDGEYYTLTGENNAPVRQGTSPVICSTTGRSGSINSIPPEFTIVIPDIAAGTHFYLEERRDNIPKGYEFVKEELTANTYDPEVLYSGNPDAEVIHRILARDENDNQDFDPSTIGRIKNGKDAESHVYNRKPTIDIPVEKVWAPANNTPDSVSLALVRFKAPDQNQHQTQDGKGAILIHHYADYGNGNEALPGGFRATYTIKKKGTDEVVFSGTGDRTYDVDPGEYTVTTTVSNWGNVPSNFSPDESGSTHTVDVNVVADQSTTAVFKSKYNVVADGTISISHNASYKDGSLSESTALPEGFRATYSIKDNATGNYVYTNVPAGDYTVAPGTYTVTAQVSSIAAPKDYYYQRTTSDDNVVVTSDQTTPVTLTSSYEYREAPPVNGTIQFSHVSAGLPGTTSLPQGFQANVVIKGATKTIENAVAGTAYDVPPGEYQIYVEKVNQEGTLPEGYFYTDTEPITVIVESGEPVSSTLISTYGQGGYLKISHEANYTGGTLENSTALPNGIQARYLIKDKDGKVLEYNAVENTEYSLAPGKYIIERIITYDGTVPQYYAREDKGVTDSKEVEATVVSGETTTATVITNYVYTPPEMKTYTITGTWTDKNGNAMTAENLPTSGSITIPIYGMNHTEVGSFTISSENGWTDSIQLPYGEGNNHNYEIPTYIAPTNEVKSITPVVASCPDTADGEFKYTAVWNGSSATTATVVVQVGHNPDVNGNTGIFLTNVPKNSTLLLSYTGIDYGNYTDNPPWELRYKTEYAWGDPTQTGNGPGQDIQVTIGNEDLYCIVIKTNASPGQVNPTLRLQESGSASRSVDLTSKKLLIASGTNGCMEGRKSFRKAFHSNRIFLFGQPKNEGTILRGISSTIPTDMTTIDLQDIDIPDSFDIPETYTLDTSFGKMLTLTNPWKYTFEDLPEYDKDGNEYYYAIIETEVPADYEVSYSPQMPVKASDIRANMLARADAEANDQPLPDLLTLTATNTTTIVEGDLQVTKTVKLNGVNDSSHGGAALTFYVGLFENGTAENAMADTVKPITVQNGSATGTVTYSGLQVGNRYYVYETDAQGHKLATGQKTDGYFVTVNGGQSDPITVTPVVNVDVENERRTGNLELNKNVTGTGADTTKQFEFTIELTPPAGESLAASYPAEHSGDNTVTTAVITEGKVTGIKLKHGEKYTIKNLPEGTAYKVIENDYSQIGYSSDASNGEGTIVRGSTGKVAVTVTNTYEATQVTLKKVDVEDLEKSNLTAEDLLKGAAFRITKYEDKTFRAKVTDWETNGSMELADVKNGENYTLNGTFTFTNLPKGFYLIEETVFPDGYIRLESNPRFEIGDDMKVYLLDESGERTGENQSEIIRVLPITATQTDNVMIYGNTPGAALPESGGSGTRMFTILGTVLIAFAGILLIRRRRTI